MRLRHLAPGDMGFDIVHFNLHKTFLAADGGGSPGGGPVAVRDMLEPFLPVPAVVALRATSSGSTTTGRRRSGRCAACSGPSGCSCVVLSFIHKAALREMSEAAVLNANYLPARLRDVRAAVRPALHE